jgi:hypothetical protein
MFLANASTGAAAGRQHGIVGPVSFSAMTIGMNIKPLTNRPAGRAIGQQKGYEMDTNSKTTEITIGKIETAPQLDPYHRDTAGLTYTCLRIYPESGLVEITQEYDDNATPEDEWSGRTIARKIDGHPKISECELIDALPTLEAIVAGHMLDYNDQGNLVGGLTDEAADALEQLVEQLSENDQHEAWTCDEWFSDQTLDDLGIGAETTDAELRSMADRYEEDAESDGVLLIDDVYDYLESRRRDARDLADED